MGNGPLVIAIIVLLLALLSIRMPTAFALGLSGAVGLLLLRDADFALNMLGSLPFDETAKFTLTIIPMFILMGMGFAAVSGSSIGTTATMSKLSVGEMRKHGYPTSLATASVAVAGTLGVLIPPSIILVLFAIMTSESVAKMLAAGILPGILSAIAYSIYVMLRARKVVVTPQRVAESENLEEALGAASTPASAGAAGTATKVRPEPPKVRFRDLSLRGLVYVAILFTVVLGGMYSGIVTATESAALGAFAALLMLIGESARKGMKATITAILNALKETAGTTSMVFSLIVGSAILSVFFVTAKVPQMLTNAVLDAGLNPYLTMLILLAALLPLGMALESLSILVITVPLLAPVAAELGFSNIWLGILLVKMIEIGMVTPPVGISCFVVSGTSGVKVADVFRGVLPFVLIDLMLVGILFAFPQIILWLPSLLVHY